MNEWFRKWFASDEYLKVYSHRNEEDANNLLNLVLNNIPQKENYKVLDAACGAGRHSLPLALKGFDVTGFDLSKTLLKVAKINSAELDLDIKYVCSDIRYVNFNAKFDLILNMFTSFGYFENDAENFMFFENAREFLNIDGIFVLDYFNKNYLENNVIPYSERVTEGRLIRENREIKNGKIIKKIKIQNNDKLYEYYESVKLYSRDEIVNVFNKLGYKLINEFGNYLGHNFNYDLSERVILFFKL